MCVCVCVRTRSSHDLEAMLALPMEGRLLMLTVYLRALGDRTLHIGVIYMYVVVTSDTCSVRFCNHLWSFVLLLRYVLYSIIYAQGFVHT